MIQKDKSQKKANKKRMEFSKKWLISCVVISIVFSLLSYVLAFLDKNTVEGLSTVIIETLWGTAGISFAGYAVQNCVRAYTSSKFGIPKEDMEENKSDENNEVI